MWGNLKNVRIFRKPPHQFPDFPYICYNTYPDFPDTQYLVYGFSGHYSPHGSVSHKTITVHLSHDTLTQ